MTRQKRKNKFGKKATMLSIVLAVGILIAAIALIVHLADTTPSAAGATIVSHVSEQTQEQSGGSGIDITSNAGDDTPPDISSSGGGNGSVDISSQSGEGDPPDLNSEP